MFASTHEKPRADFDFLAIQRWSPWWNLNHLRWLRVEIHENPAFFKDSYITYRVGWSTKHEGRLIHLSTRQVVYISFKRDSERIHVFHAWKNRSKNPRSCSKILIKNAVVGIRDTNQWCPFKTDNFHKSNSAGKDLVKEASLILYQLLPALKIVQRASATHMLTTSFRPTQWKPFHPLTLLMAFQSDDRQIRFIACLPIKDLLWGV